MQIFLAIVFALMSATLNALASIFQRKATGQVHPRQLFRGQIVTNVIKNRLWLSGIGLNIVAFFGQAIALHNGSLALVEPLLITDVVFLLVFLHFGFKRRVSRQGFSGAVLLVFGLSCLLVVAHPQSISSEASFGKWLAAIIAVGLIILGSAILIRTIRMVNLRAVVGGFAAGLHFAFTAAFTKLVVTELQQSGVLDTLFSWQLLALIIVGISSALTMQSMYGAGPLVITQPTLEITEALAGIFMGILLFGDIVNDSVGALAIEAASGLVAASGIILLARTTNSKEATLPKKEQT